MITLVTKEEREHAFWSGLVDGGSIFGSYLPKAVQSEKYPLEWYETRDLVPRDPLGEGTTEEEDAYLLGYVTSSLALGMTMYGMGVGLGLDVGLFGAAGSAALVNLPHYGVGAGSVAALYFGHKATLGSPGVNLETVDPSGGHGHGGGKSYTATPTLGIAGWILSWFE